MFIGNKFLKNRIFKFNIVLFCLFILLLMIQTVTAHPPSKLNLNYDDDINDLTVNITHSVSSDDHYIDTIEIYINDLKYNFLSYDSQPSRMSFSYNYNIIADEGDTIKIIAKCNQFGILTRELTVGEDNGSSTPGFLIITLIISFVIILFKRKK